MHGHHHHRSHDLAADQRAPRPHDSHRPRSGVPGRAAPDQQGTDLLRNRQEGTGLQGQQDQGLRPVSPVDGAAGADHADRRHLRLRDGPRNWPLNAGGLERATPRKGGYAIIGS